MPTEAEDDWTIPVKIAPASTPRIGLENIRKNFVKLGSFRRPETEPDSFAEAYLSVPVEKIRAYSAAQFYHWTEEPFSANFRRMLTLEQYRTPEFGKLYQNYLASGPLEYMAAIFRKLTETDEEARQLALDFYGPMYLLYSVYDSAEEKEAVPGMLDEHIDRFIARVETDYRKGGTKE